MTRTRLIDQIFTSLGLDYHKVTTKNTPAENDVIFKKPGWIPISGYILVYYSGTDDFVLGRA